MCDGASQHDYSRGAPDQVATASTQLAPAMPRDEGASVELCNLAVALVATTFYNFELPDFATQTKRDCILTKK